MDRIALLQGIRDEIAALEKALAHDPRQKQLTALRATLGAFNAGAQADRTTPLAAVEGSEDDDPTNKEIRAYLRGRDWTHKKSILKHLIEKGVAGSAEDPRKALGKRLFRMDDVEGDRKGNYRLKRGA